MYGYIYIYFSHIYLAWRPHRPVSERRGARRVVSSLVSLVPRCSEPLVSPHFVAPPTSPLCVPIPVLVLRSSAPLSLCPALCRPPGAPARLPAPSQVSFPSLVCVSAPQFLFFLFLCLSVPRLDAQSRSRPSNGLVVTVHVHHFTYRLISKLASCAASCTLWR